MAEATIIHRSGIVRKPGFLYYIDKQGDISCCQMKQGKRAAGKPSKVLRSGIWKTKGFLYFVSKQGHICRMRMTNASREITKTF